MLGYHLFPETTGIKLSKAFRLVKEVGGRYLLVKVGNAGNDGDDEGYSDGDNGDDDVIMVVVMVMMIIVMWW